MHELVFKNLPLLKPFKTTIHHSSWTRILPSQIISIVLDLIYVLESVLIKIGLVTNMEQDVDAKGKNEKAKQIFDGVRDRMRKEAGSVEFVCPFDCFSRP